MVGDKAKNLFKIYDKDRTLIHVTKNPNFQTVTNKEYWPDANYIVIEHFNSYDDLEFARYDASQQIGKGRTAKSVITMFPGNDGE